MDNKLAVQKFFEKLTLDNELRCKFQELLERKSFDEAYEFALSNSSESFSKEDFENYIFELSKAINEEKAPLLKETSLDRISGGAGVLPTTDKFWTSTQNADQGKIITSIYKNEEDMIKEKNKSDYIKKGFEAIHSINGLIKVMGELFLTREDNKLKRAENEPTKLAQEIEDTKNAIEIKKIKRRLDAKGIKY